MRISVNLFVLIGLTLYHGALTLTSCPADCHPPDCSCPRFSYPMDRREIPQMVYFGFDDAVNVVMSALYDRIFTEERKNPNGCKIKMTLFVSHQYTDYKRVKGFYNRGHEIAVHSVTHTAIDTEAKLRAEAAQQKRNIVERAGVPASEIKGWRSPFLKPAGNSQPVVLKELGYEYDISFTYSRSHMDVPKPWPFTMDRGWPYRCGVRPCPTRSRVPNFWAVPVVSLMDHENQYPCSFVDGCAIRAQNEDEAFQFLMDNFMSYYNTTRTPFGLNMHAAWFYTRYNLKAMMRFLDELAKMDDVYVVTVKQMIEWLKHPTPLSDIQTLDAWSCPEARNKQEKPAAPPTGLPSHAAWEWTATEFHRQPVPAKSPRPTTTTTTAATTTRRSTAPPSTRRHVAGQLSFSVGSRFMPLQQHSRSNQPPKVNQQVVIPLTRTKHGNNINNGNNVDSVRDSIDNTNRNPANKILNTDQTIFIARSNNNNNAINANNKHNNIIIHSNNTPLLSDIASTVQESPKSTQNNSIYTVNNNNNINGNNNKDTASVHQASPQSKSWLNIWLDPNMVHMGCAQGVNCKLPGCFCQGTSIPSNLAPADTPQMVFLTIDGSLNLQVYRRYMQFLLNKKNPNGCPARGTIFASGRTANRDILQRFLKLGAEIAIQGLHEHHYESTQHLEEELVTQLKDMNKHNVTVSGWKTPELKALGNEQYQILQRYGLKYDATISENLPKTGTNKAWPYTLDFGHHGGCVIPECPTAKFPGLWEIPSNSILDYRKFFECTYIDGCMFNPPTMKDTVNFLWDNFMDNYKTNRAPFGVQLRQVWFTHPAYSANLKGLTSFIEKLLTLKDVYLVSASDVITWMENPVKVQDITDTIPWDCAS